MTDPIPTVLNQVASRFAVEIHIPAPSLAKIVRESVEIGVASGRRGKELRSWLACEIEDGLAVAGEGLYRHLQPHFLDRWQAHCSWAFDKALAAVEGGLTL